MERFEALTRGLQIGNRENSNVVPLYPLNDLFWLSRRAVEEDKAVSGLDHHGSITDTRMYVQRLVEIDFGGDIAN